MDPGREDGVALLIALMALLLLTVLGAGLVLITSSEALISANFLGSMEALYAADAAAERAMAELGSGAADWNGVLAGSGRSTFADGPPVGSRPMADGSVIDLGGIVNSANCGKAAGCSGAEMDAVTTERPWGANNPRWQLYAYGWLRDLAPAATVNSAFYIVVLVGDDPAENDGNPLQDGAGVGNPGSGVLAVRATALGPRGARKTVEVTLARQGGPRLLAWREVR